MQNCVDGTTNNPISRVIILPIFNICKGVIISNLKIARSITPPLQNNQFSVGGTSSKRHKSISQVRNTDIPVGGR
jgi:hypothetical protein